MELRARQASLPLLFQTERAVSFWEIVEISIRPVFGPPRGPFKSPSFLKCERIEFIIPEGILFTVGLPFQLVTCCHRQPASTVHSSLVQFIVVILDFILLFRVTHFKRQDVHKEVCYYGTHLPQQEQPSCALVLSLQPLALQLVCFLLVWISPQK